MLVKVNKMARAGLAVVEFALVMLGLALAYDLLRPEPAPWYERAAGGVLGWAYDSLYAVSSWLF